MSTSPKERLSDQVVMTNFDHSIDDGVAAQLKDRTDAWAAYTAWNFYGHVWWTGTEWACEVWVYGSPSGVVYEATLPDVMRVVCEEYGTD